MSAWQAEMNPIRFWMASKFFLARVWKGDERSGVSEDAEAQLLGPALADEVNSADGTAKHT